MPINKVIYGNQTLIDLTDSTVTAGDLRDGVIAYDKSGTKIIGDTDWQLTLDGVLDVEKIPDTEDDYRLLQGEGVTNVVIGSFTTEVTGGVAQTIQIPYVGDGYPISAMIYVSGGPYNPEVTDWYDAIDQYAIGMWTMAKTIQDSDPSYTNSGSENRGSVMIAYKSNSTSAASMARDGSMTANVFSASNAAAAVGTCCRFKSSTELSVYVADTSYGLMPGIEYTYQIIYSE